MAPKIDTSTASGSVQKLRNARGSTQPGRYEQLRVARGMILADREAKKARSTRQARQIPTSSSDSDTVIGEKHAKKTSVIWQHMSQEEVDGRKKNNL